jgi:hypothetical protein
VSYANVDISSHRPQHAAASVDYGCEDGRLSLLCIFFLKIRNTTSHFVDLCGTVNDTRAVGLVRVEDDEVRQ